MKNSIKLTAIAAILSAIFASCETKPGSLSYTLNGNMDYLSQYTSYFSDSLFYNQGVYLDDLSYLWSNCTEMNAGFVGGWKISMKKGGGPEDSYEFLWLASAGKNAGALESACYAVYQPSDDPTQMKNYDIMFNFSGFTNESCSVQGMYINNTKAVENMAAAGEIVSGDFVKLTASFYKNDALQGSEECYLVDYTGAELKVVTDWKAWETEDARLWNVDAIKFTVEVSGPKFEPVFCMDNLVASISLEY